MIMIVSGYTLDSKYYMANPVRGEWVTTSLCENTRYSYPKKSVPDLSDLIAIWDVIVVLWLLIYNVFTGASYDDPGYDSSLVIILAKTCTG